MEGWEGIVDRHQQRQRRIEQLRKEVEEAEETIIQFGQQLAELEQRVWNESVDVNTLRSLDGAITKREMREGEREREES